MIDSKQDLHYYLLMDRKANMIPAPSIKLWLKNIISPNYIWRYIVALRKTEYYKNRKNKFGYVFYKLKLKRIGVKLGFYTPPNVFGHGLYIPHSGIIVVNANARVGKNCQLMHGVTIGAGFGSNDSAKIGDNVFIGCNASIIG